MPLKDGVIGGTADPLGEQPTPVPSADAAEQEVRHRHVLYVPGYDPRDPGLYRRLAAFELRRFAKLWGVKVDVDEAHVDDPATPSIRWNARVSAGDAKVDVTYETLRWDDLVARDFSVPLWLKLARGFGTTADVLFTGHLFRIARASPWCAVAWAYPIGLMAVMIALGFGLGWGAWALGAAYGFGVAGVIVGVAVALATPIAFMAAARKAKSFLLHLMDDGASQIAYAHRRDAAMQARVDAFADRIRALMAEDGPQELLIVGHSSGSFIAIDAIARAFEADPAMGEGKPSLALLTVGASELLVAMHPSAGWFRERLKRLALETSVFWAEVVGPWDMLNFPHRDPVTELKLDVPDDRPNPTFRRAFLTKMLKADSIARLRRDRNIFRAHFQFVMANEVRGPFDYFSLICGPWRARTQFRRTAKGAYMSPYLGPAVYPPPKS